MRNQQRVVVARRPPRQHAFEPALDAIGEAGAALAGGIDVGRRESIGVPARELVGIAIANLIRGEPFEQSEVHLDEVVDRDYRRRAARDDSRALGRTNQRTRKNVSEGSVAAPRLDRTPREAHLRASEFRQRDVGAAVIPDARLALGLAMTNENQP